jgi:hypothetical protein
MSTSAAARRLVPASVPAPRPERRLVPVTAPRGRRRPKLVYGVVAVMGAIAIGAAQMSLSILTTQTSYELSSLTQQQRELDWQRQIIADDIAGLSSPQYLAANATALGMVIEESPSYLRLSDGAIVGTSGMAIGSSSVNALGRGAVANSLITDTPLVTDPDATIAGLPTDTTGQTTDTPPPLTDGLPTPSTH